MKLLPALCVLVFLVAVTPQKEASQVPMRLCGREFLRAVVYTCGGSRWRRSLDDVFTDDAESGDAPRFRRNEDTELPDLCCRVGCGKSDLTLMC